MLVRINNFRINYDSDNDILYLSFAEPKPSYGEEKYEGVIFRYDFITEELSGITIFDFKKKMQDNYFSQLDIPQNIDFKSIEQIIN